MVAHRIGGDEEPAVLAIEAAQARFHVTGLAGSNNGSPACDQLWQVFGVDYGVPPSATCLIHKKAGIFTPAPIEEVDVAIRERCPHWSGKRVDDTAEPKTICRGAFGNGTTDSTRCSSDERCSWHAFFLSNVYYDASSRTLPYRWPKHDSDENLRLPQLRWFFPYSYLQRTGY